MLLENKRPVLQRGAFNLGWIITGWLELEKIGRVHLQHGDTIVAMTSPNLLWRVLSRGTFWRAYLGLLTLARGRKNRLALLLALTTCEAMNFMLNTGVHGNHAFLTRLCSFVASYGGALNAFSIAVAATPALSNVLFFYGIHAASAGLGSVGNTVLSLIDVLICGMLACNLIVECRAGRRADVFSETLEKLS